MATVDPAFKIIPKGQACFFIWRIENLQVVPVPRESHGTFFKGDAYIVLSARDTKGALDMHAHFWIGSESTQDEQGVAAYKTVELDDYLGGAPVQHRETEGAESSLFLNYFKKKGGLTYKNGGVASGFNHVDMKMEPRLFQAKGKHVVRLTELRTIDWSSMNQGDVFILDLGSVIFCWNGKNSNRAERLQAMQRAKQVRDDRGGNANVIVIEDGEESRLSADEQQLFESKLPLKDKRNIKLESSDDARSERDAAATIKLYRCADEQDGLKVTEVKGGPLVKADLDTKDSYIIDNGPNGIWAWIGKGASNNERKEAMRNAMGFLKKKNYPDQTAVTRVIDGGESTEFKALFSKWPEPAATKGLGRTYTVGNVAKVVQTRFDAATMHHNRGLAAETQMVDDGTGKIEMWRVESFEMKPVPKQSYGQFYGGDCYLILYTYQVQNRDNYIVYYWLGHKSTADEQGAAARFAVELDDKHGGTPVQVRVVQGKEPPHFMAMFGGRMVVFEGGHASGFRNSGEKDTDGPGDTFLLHVRGTSKMNSKAVQVPCRAVSLNSNDVFVFFVKSATYIWCGKGSTGDEREMAKTVASLRPCDPVTVFEGQEKPDLWQALGGQAPYSNDKRLQEPDVVMPVRLFQLSNATGRIQVEEVNEFTQEDLVPEDVMLLDSWDTIFLWIGENSNKQERDEAEQVAFGYLRTDPSGRDSSIPVVRIKQGNEPPTFTGFFGFWNHDYWTSTLSYDAVKAHTQARNEPQRVVEKPVAGTVPTEVAKYPYEMLAKPASQLPDGVNPENREVHLLDSDFSRIFGTTYAQFVSKPAWKQRDMKKAANLF